MDNYRLARVATTKKLEDANQINDISTHLPDVGHGNS